MGKVKEAILRNEKVLKEIDGFIELNRKELRRMSEDIQQEMRKYQFIYDGIPISKKVIMMIAGTWSLINYYEREISLNKETLKDVLDIAGEIAEVVEERDIEKIERDKEKPQEIREKKEKTMTEKEIHLKFQATKNRFLWKARKERYNKERVMNDWEIYKIGKTEEEKIYLDSVRDEIIKILEIEARTRDLKNGDSKANAPEIKESLPFETQRNYKAEQNIEKENDNDV